MQFFSLWEIRELTNFLYMYFEKKLFDADRLLWPFIINIQENTNVLPLSNYGNNLWQKIWSILDMLTRGLVVNWRKKYFLLPFVQGPTKEWLDYSKKKCDSSQLISTRTSIDIFCQCIFPQWYIMYSLRIHGDIIFAVFAYETQKQ